MKLDINQLLQKAITTHQEGKLDEARNLYLEILKTEPKHPDANHNLGLIVASLNKPTESLKLFKIATEENPNKEQFWISYTNQLIKENKLDEAEVACRKAIEINPGSAEIYNFLGLILNNFGRLEEAEVTFKKAIEVNPSILKSHFNLGVIFYKLSKFEKAEISFKKTIELKPDYTEAYNNLGNTFTQLKKFEEAEVNYNKAIELKPDHAETYNNLGVALDNAFKIDKSIDYFKKAIQINPKFINAFYNLGNAYLYLEKYDEAIEKYSQILELNPNHTRAQQNIIDILNFHIADNENTNSIIVANNNLKKIKNNFTFNHISKISDLSNFFENSNKIIQRHNKDLTTTNTQIYRINSTDLGCDRHFRVFNKFNLIPKFCFSCFKIQIEPTSVLELFKLFFIFDELKLPKNNIRKCFVELRPDIPGTYKGLIYCSSTGEANEIIKMITPIINKLTDSRIKIKRGCSEFSKSFPEFEEINKDKINFMKYKNEWEEKEKIIDATKIKDFKVRDTLGGLSISDVLIMNNWLNYAKEINDLTYKDIDKKIFKSTFISEKLSNQLDTRKKNFLNFIKKTKINL